MLNVYKLPSRARGSTEFLARVIGVGQSGVLIDKELVTPIS